MGTSDNPRRRSNSRTNRSQRQSLKRSSTSTLRISIQSSTNETSHTLKRTTNDITDSLPFTQPRTDLEVSSSLKPHRKQLMETSKQTPSTGDKDSIQADVGYLRSKIEDYAEKGMVKNALLLCGKLIALHPLSKSDIFLYAKLLCRDQQYRRAVHYMNKNEMLVARKVLSRTGKNRKKHEQSVDQETNTDEMQTFVREAEKKLFHLATIDTERDEIENEFNRLNVRNVSSFSSLSFDMKEGTNIDIDLEDSVDCAPNQMLWKSHIEKEQHKPTSRLSMNSEKYAEPIPLIIPSSTSSKKLVSNIFRAEREVGSVHQSVQNELQTCDLAEEFIPESLPYITLAVHCLLGCGEKEEALELLDSTIHVEDSEEMLQLCRAVEAASSIDIHSDIAALCLIKGKILLENEDHIEAVFWLKTAVCCDAFCLEAVDLLSNHQLTRTEAKVFHEELVQLPDARAGKHHWLDRLIKFYLLGDCMSVASLTAELKQVRGDDKWSDYSAAVDHLLCSLARDSDVLCGVAKLKLQSHDIEEAYLLTKYLINKDPFNIKLLTIHVEVLLSLGKKAELYYYANYLMKTYPMKAIAWFTVGCHYLLNEKYEGASTYLMKATTMDKNFVNAFLAYGHCLALHSVSDKSLGLYRHCSERFVGCHLFPVHIAMEFSKMNNTVLAEQYLLRAKEMCDTDPVVFNELGIIYYEQHRFEEAEACFRAVYQLVSQVTCSSNLIAKWEPAICNLAHCLRRQERLDEAIYFYRLCLQYNQSDTVHLSIGLSYHMRSKMMQLISRTGERSERELKKAIRHYELAQGMNVGFYQNYCAMLLRIGMTDYATLSETKVGKRGEASLLKQMRMADSKLSQKLTVTKPRTATRHQSEVAKEAQVVPRREADERKAKVKEFRLRKASELYRQLDFGNTDEQPKIRTGNAESTRDEEPSRSNPATREEHMAPARGRANLPTNRRWQRETMISPLPMLQAFDELIQTHERASNPVSSMMSGPSTGFTQSFPSGATEVQRSTDNLDTADFGFPLSYRPSSRTAEDEHFTEEEFASRDEF